MNSKEEFQFEVPLLGTDDITWGHSVGEVNDCDILEVTAKPDTTEAISNRELRTTASIILENSDKDNDCTIVEINNISINNNKHDIMLYDEIYRENKIFLELIEKCLDMENSKGMLRIINRTLIPIYKDAIESFRNSVGFKKVLFDTMLKLDREPERKFTLVREICEILKLKKTPQSKMKKRVSFTTLRTNLNGKSSKHIYNPYSNHRHDAKKRKKMSSTSSHDNTVIDCDSSDAEICNVGKPIEVLDSDSNSSDNDVIAIDDKDNSSKEDNLQINNTPCSELENNNVNEKEDNSGHLLQISHEVVTIDDEDNSNKENDININKTPSPELRNNNMNEKDDNSDDLQIISHEVVKNEAKIKDIERRIGMFHKLISQLEEQEVQHDTTASEYVLCEQYKETVVQLYKELCKLTGTEAVKRHEVRLKVADGHPEGPVRCLEEFINSGIDEQGNPPFPDMLDVMQCVCKANIKYKLNWNRRQILSEAQALFVHYGSAIQKRRQGREWRHLQSYVKEEAPDPADTDVQLQAKLEHNLCIARRREQDLLDRFAERENPSAINSCGLDVRIESEDSGDSDNGSSSPISVPNIRNINNDAELRLNSYETSCNGNITENVSMYVVNNNIDIVTEVRNVNNMNRNEVPSIPDTLAIASLNCDNSAVYSRVVSDVNMDANQDNTSEMTDDCVVKEEPEDIGRMLEELGDDFTTTIIDIMDPFAVIEISDSSESEDEEMFYVST